MLIDFFFALRAARLPVTIPESLNATGSARMPTPMIVLAMLRMQEASEAPPPSVAVARLASAPGASPCKEG